MVHCLICYQELPYDCVCDVPPEEKLLRYIESAEREVELIIAIGKGFKPKIQAIMVKREKQADKDFIMDIEPETEKVTDYFYKLKFKIDIKSYQPIFLILLDTRGEPLYVTDIVQKIGETSGDELTVSWNLGIPPPKNVGGAP